MGYAPPPRPCGDGHIQGCTRHEPVGSFSADLEVFLTLSRTRARRHTPNAHRVTPTSGYGHHASRMPPCFHGARAHTDLPGFPPLRRSQMAASTNMPVAAFAAAARACLTRYVPSSGLHTLLTVCSATTPAGLFHPARALGVPPFRAYSRRAGTPLGALCPPDVSVTDLARRRALPTFRTEPWPEYSGFDTHAAGGRPPSPSGLLLPSETQDFGTGV